jgi:hypothetical protein
MREELIQLLAALASSRDAANEVEAFPGLGFDEWWNLTDDVLPEGAEAALGVVLHTNEVAPVAAFLAQRDDLWTEFGPHGTFKEYATHPSWSAVIAAAIEALAVMCPESQQAPPGD